jgi:hypothetical protein
LTRAALLRVGETDARVAGTRAAQVSFALGGFLRHGGWNPVGPAIRDGTPLGVRWIPTQ